MSVYLGPIACGLQQYCRVQGKPKIPIRWASTTGNSMSLRIDLEHKADDYRRASILLANKRELENKRRHRGIETWEQKEQPASYDVSEVTTIMDLICWCKTETKILFNRSFYLFYFNKNVMSKLTKKLNETKVKI